MRRETKFGLGVIGTLAVALGGVVAMRVAKPPVAAEASNEREAREALAALEASRASSQGTDEKPTLFSMNEAKFKETPGTALRSESPDRTTQAPAHQGHNRYAVQPAAPEAPATDDAPPASFDPFQRPGQPESPASSGPTSTGPTAPLVDPSASSQPQATLSSGIEAMPAGTPPLVEPAPLAPMSNEMPLTPGSNTLAAPPAGYDPSAPTAVQTAGTGEPAADSRYTEFRTSPSSTHHPAGHPQTGWDRYNPSAANAAPQSGMHHPTTPHATIGGAHPGQRTPQYDVYGRDISNERDDPPPEMPAPRPVTPQDTDMLGRRLDNVPPVEQPHHHHHHEGETYTVAPNDNYWSIAQKVYGNGGYFKAIEEHNRERYPYSERLRTGDVVAVPGIKTLEEKYPDLCPKRREAVPGRASGLLTSSHGGMPGARVYKVREGDTLFDIARSELGKASRWAEIYELNRDQLGSDFDFLAPGMELALPENRTEHDPLTTQSHPLRTR